MDEAARTELTRNQLMSLEHALEMQTAAAHEQRHLVHQDLPPVPCPACGAPTAGITMSSYADGSLLIDAAPCGHLFRTRVDDMRNPGNWLP